jgi:hypothetical protein
VAKRLGLIRFGIVSWSSWHIAHQTFIPSNHHSSSFLAAPNRDGNNSTLTSSINIKYQQQQQEQNAF